MQQRFSHRQKHLVFNFISPLLFSLLILPSFSPSSSSSFLCPLHLLPLLLCIPLSSSTLSFILILTSSSSATDSFSSFYFTSSSTSYFLLSFPDLLLLLSYHLLRPLVPPPPLLNLLLLFYYSTSFLFSSSSPSLSLYCPSTSSSPPPVSSLHGVIFHARHQPDVTPEQHVSLYWRSMGPGFHIFSLFTSSFVFIFFFTDVGHLTVWHRFQISAAGTLIHYSSVPSWAAIGCRERRKYVSTTCWCTASCGQTLIDICFLAAAGSRMATVAMSS